MNRSRLAAVALAALLPLGAFTACSAETAPSPATSIPPP